MRVSFSVLPCSPPLPHESLKVKPTRLFFHVFITYRLFVMMERWEINKILERVWGQVPMSFPLSSAYVLCLVYLLIAFRDGNGFRNVASPQKTVTNGGIPIFVRINLAVYTHELQTEKNELLPLEIFVFQIHFRPP